LRLVDTATCIVLQSGAGTLSFVLLRHAKQREMNIFAIGLDQSSMGKLQSGSALASSRSTLHLVERWLIGGQGGETWKKDDDLRHMEVDIHLSLICNCAVERVPVRC